MNLDLSKGIGMRSANRHSQTSSCVVCEAAIGEPRSLHARTCERGECRLEFRRHLQAGRPICGGCGRPLSAFLAARGSCGRSECLTAAHRLKLLPAERRCQICTLELATHREAAGVCDDRECNAIAASAREAERRRQIRARFDRLTVLAGTLRDERAAAEGVPEPESYLPTVVPLFDAPLAPLPDERRRELVERLQLLVEELAAEMRDDFSAEESAEESADEDEPLHNVTGNPWPDVGLEGERLVSTVCGTCRGFCCRNGGTHAFLSVATLRTLLRRRPDLQPEQLVDEYLHQLPDESFRDSCVFHSETGCALPPEMRAATCSLYFCTGQQELRASLERGGPRRAFVAVAQADDDNEQIVDGVFVSGEW